MLTGGFTKFHPLTEEDQQIFNTALKGLKGVDYEPFAVATQVVSGVNYRYLCNATMVTNPPREFTAQVIIYKPLEGDPVLTHISECN